MRFPSDTTFENAGSVTNHSGTTDGKEHHWIGVNRVRAARSVPSHHLHPEEHPPDVENEQRSAPSVSWITAKAMVSRVRPQLERPGCNGGRESVENDTR